MLAVLYTSTRLPPEACAWHGSRHPCRLTPATTTAGVPHRRDVSAGKHTATPDVFGCFGVADAVEFWELGP